MEKRVPLVPYGSQLWTRERAREIRERLVDELDQMQEGDTLVIDIKGVEVFDYSFANELFGKTLLSLPREYSGQFCIVEHLTPYTRENLIKALESLSLVMIERKGRKLQLLGKVHPTDQTTFDAIVRAKRPITAAELRDQLGVSLNAMNERLTKLTGFALIRRERGVSPAGRAQYAYSVLG